MRASLLFSFSLSLVTACSDGGPPVPDGQRIDLLAIDAGSRDGLACRLDERRCAGRNVERCSPAGTWEVQETCPLNCESGSCAGPCQPGARDCDGPTPRSCSTQGVWLPEAPCPYACVAGSCQGECLAGAKQCQGSVPQTCSASGQWVSGAPCPYLCAGGACSGVCKPGAKDCQGATPRTCDAQGSWLAGAPCPFVCTAGACQGECAPGAKQCLENVPQTCSASGTWVAGAACPVLCSGGSCVGTCTPGEKQCSGLTPQTCSASGSWTSGTPCPYLCAAGACGGVCKPGATQCSGLTPQTCSAAGAWASGTACPHVCTSGACTGLCTPGATQCSGKIPQTCSSAGAWVDGTACPYLCTNGSCTGVCAPGAKQCSNTIPQTCSAAGAWVNGPACPCACSAGSCTSCSDLFLEAESFTTLGGWKIDSQFVETMGSPYLLAHGKGKPVASASRAVHFPGAGAYRLWVRTKDWVPPHQPGTFQVAVGSTTHPTVFGKLAAWGWEDGGVVQVTAVDTTISLIDKTGFDGRCDALYFTQNLGATAPPGTAAALQSWRRLLLGIPDPPPSAGSFDLIVVGGGIAGAAATLAGARRGLSVALIHDREFVGGNASQEVRVHTCGYLGEGFARSVVDDLDWDIACEIEPAGSDKSIGYDVKRGQILAAEANAHLFLQHRAVGVQVASGHIQSVDAVDTRTGNVRRFVAPLVVDATGDGWIGYWAGATYRMGREAQSELGESLAPAQADTMKLGTSVLWSSIDTGSPTTFPDVRAWTSDVAKGYTALEGDWRWEYGIVPAVSTIDHAEEIRDNLLRAAYGVFYNTWAAGAKTRALGWVAYIAGKRESRRLVGDYLLREQDIRGRIAYPDTIAIGSWPIDLHYANPCRGCCSGCDWTQCGCAACSSTCDLNFLSYAVQTKVQTFGIPYRSLYSKDIDNLFMAGRDLSASHVALGATRVMNTNGQMGAAVAVAASLCKKYGTSPRGVYQNHLAELISATTGVSQPLGPLIRIGYIQSNGARSWSQTCEMSGAGVQDCTEADHPFSAWALPPAGLTPDAGTHISDRYTFVHGTSGALKLRDGYVQSNGAKSWSRTCDLDRAGTVGTCGGFSTYGPPGGITPDAGQVINARYAFVYSAGAVTRLHNGFVQSNGAKSWSVTCDIDAAGVTSNCGTPQVQALPPAGVTPDAGQVISDRYAFAYRVNGAQKLRNGFMQSDGKKSWSQTCDISSAGVIDCSLAAHPMQPWTQPPPGVTPDAGASANHRYEFAVHPY